MLTSDVFAEFSPLTAGFERWANLPPSNFDLQSFGHASVMETRAVDRRPLSSRSFRGSSWLPVPLSWRLLCKRQSMFCSLSVGQPRERFAVGLDRVLMLKSASLLASRDR